MRTKQFAGLLLVLMVFAGVDVPSIYAEQTVYFADANLKSAIEQRLNVSNPTPSDMLRLTSLYAEQKGIVSLIGLEYATNLYNLFLDNNQISNIEPLSGLTNLKQLDLRGNQITNIQALSGLTNLSWLSLSNNQISNIQPISGLTNLGLLFLDNNQITNIEPLLGMTNLYNLSLDNNQITNIQPMSGMTNLYWLNLGYNQISNIQPLSGMTNLGWLYLSNNQISNIQPLSGMTKLYWLNLGYNQITNIHPLSGLKNLGLLFLDNNQITNIEPLSGLNNVFWFDLSNNQISNIQPLSGLTYIGWLYLHGNPLNWEAYDIYIPKILENNPEITLSYDPPPSVTIQNTAQLKSDNATQIPIGGTTDEPTVVFKAKVHDEDGGLVKLQIELRRIDEYEGKFLNEFTQESGFVASGSEATVTVYGLVNGDYHWQARAIDERRFDSGWVQFGNNGISDTDFVVSVVAEKSLPEKAAELAKQVIGVDYVWSAQGWNWDPETKKWLWEEGRFLDPYTIKEGYYYYDYETKQVQFGHGLDCSGLVFWSYNKAYGSKKYTDLENPIFYNHDASQQYWANCEPIAKENMLAGDLLFFNTSDPGNPDHVAMYVGSFVRGSYNVVHASGYTHKVTPAFYNQQTEKLVTVNPETGESQSLSVTYYGRVTNHNKKTTKNIAMSPVDLIVTDPYGNILTKQQHETASMFYAEWDTNGDGKTDDVVTIIDRQTGTYSIALIPEQGALPDDTYTLEVTAGDDIIILADHVPIRDIPSQPYILRCTDTEVIPVIPARIDFKPDTMNLESKGQWVTVYIELPLGHGYGIGQIDLGTLMLNSLIRSEAKPNEIGDYDGDGIPDLMVKFNGLAVQKILNIGDAVRITLTGNLIDGRLFEGTDTIRVISQGSVSRM